MNSRPPIIAVIGGRKVDKALMNEAENVGRLIAEKRVVLACGGLQGIMEAASNIQNAATMKMVNGAARA
jgi:predicted Rossmann-fold nucleotide-binding protein